MKQKELFKLLNLIISVILITFAVYQSNKIPTDQTNTEYSAKSDDEYYYVTRVIDGDTFDVNYKDEIKRVRMLGINTPETKDPRKKVECFGKEAFEMALTKLKNNQVKLERDVTQSDKDRYGRLLRYVYLSDGTLVNYYLILEGYAYEYTFNTPYELQKEFKDAENDARKNKRGLWANNKCNLENQSLLLFEFNFRELLKD